ncbi:phosphoenolpyruvate carboxykinase [Candidatus Micrarchaeota archaeon]|nr:phosphoenolpyruvate carboxykinase [Candidatus Micrarchaeota archaeon]
METALKQLKAIREATPLASIDELLSFSSERLEQTSTGGISVQSQVTHRLAKKTEIIFEPTEEHEAFVKKVLGQCLKEDMVKSERCIGKQLFLASVLLPKKYGWIAAYWATTQFDPVEKEPDITTINLPEWPEQKILVFPDLGLNIALGSDYIGETKMSILRSTMYLAKKQGFIGLHAGSKSITLNSGMKGALLFGLSGTGKTTLSTHSLFLRPPEKTVVHQDDIVILKKEGAAIGTEQNFYVKTEGISQQNQPEIYKACMTDHSLLENVALKDGQPDFQDVLRTSNGRAVVFRKDLPYSNGVDLDKVDLIFFITRRRDILPAAAKLTPEQAAAFFMLGESVETSAGDPTQAGKTKRVAGFNPFVVGDPAEEGNRMLEFIKSIVIQCFLLNTGAIAEKISIKPEISAKLIEQVARGKVEWRKDEDWGYEVPVKIGSLEIGALNPRQYYSEEEYSEKTNALKAERKAWLEQFEGLKPEILDSLRLQ